MNVSVIVPIKDEAQSLPILYKELTASLSKLGKTYELIFIDDGSTDNSYAVLQSLKQKNVPMIAIRFLANFGKSAALATGLKYGTGDIIVTIDADLQDDPRDIPIMVDRLQPGVDFICGWRKNRQDSIIKKVSSSLFNWLVCALTGIYLHDVNCGLKVFTRQVALRLSIHGELHRFIPILAAKQKFRVSELPTHHRKRRFGHSKYGLERSWRGFVDLLTTVFLTDYAGKPAHFFGKLGLLFFGTGFMMDAFVAYLRITTGSTQERLPLLLAGILLMVLGVQLLSTGLIAEMIIHQHPVEYPPHIIEKN